jgi:flagellar hook-associated protein 2
MASVSGVSTSSDLQSLFDSYRSSISKPVYTMQTKQNALQSRVSALNDLKSKLTSLQTTITDLAKSGSESKINSYKVSSSAESVVTATATATALEGSHLLKVSQVAKSDTVVTNRMVSSDTTVSASQGTGIKTFSITLNGTTTDISITIDDGDTNSAILTKIAAAVNTADTGITASAVDDTSTTKKLMFVSKSTGAAQAISLQNVTGTLLNDLGLNSTILSGRIKSTSTTAGYSYTSPASLNAQFTLDGIDFEKETNSVTDVLTGITLDLKNAQASTDSEVTLTVSANKEDITGQINTFITNYNAVLTYLNQKTSIDATTNTRQIFAGDSTIVGLKYSLRNIVSGLVPGTTAGNPKMLSDIGIETSRDGTLSLKDPEKLQEKLSTVSAVTDLFNSSGGIATSMQTVLKSMLSYGSGQIEMVTKNTSSQITYYQSRIQSYNERIDKQVAKYQDDFLRLQAVYQQIVSQQNTISSIMSTYFG